MPRPLSDLCGVCGELVLEEDALHLSEHGCHRAQSMTVNDLDAAARTVARVDGPVTRGEHFTACRLVAAAAVHCGALPWPTSKEREDL